MIVACTQTLFYFSFRKHRRARVLLPPPPYAGGSINPPQFYFLSRALNGLWRENRGPVNRLQWSSPESLILVMLLFLQTFFGLKTAFQNCKWFQKLKHFRIFFSSRSSLTLNSAISLFFTQIVIFSIFSSAHRLDDLPQEDLSIRPVYQIRPRSDHHAGPSDQTATPDHQIRSPHQTTDHHPWLLSFQSSQHTQPLEMVQVRCIPYGLGEGGYIELWMNLAKHTFHTLSAWIFRTFFRLNLTVVRLASGVPRAGKVLPCPFS